MLFHLPKSIICESSIPMLQPWWLFPHGSCVPSIYLDLSTLLIVLYVIRPLVTPLSVSFSIEIGIRGLPSFLSVLTESRAATRHPVRGRWKSTPSLNGSIFNAFRYILIRCGCWMLSTATQSTDRSYEGLNDQDVFVHNFPDCRKPKSMWYRLPMVLLCLGISLPTAIGSLSDRVTFVSYLALNQLQ